LDTKLVKPEGFSKSNVPPKTGVPAKTAVPAEPPPKAAVDGRAGRPSASTVPLLNAAASLGFPKDPLSVALLVFTRFFSVSADKVLIGSLRREILDLVKTSSPGTAEEKAALEAKAMAAVVAANKGVFLSPAALERYARFLMPTPFMATPFMATAFMPPPFMATPFMATKTAEEKEAPSNKAPVSSQDKREKPAGKTREESPEPEELKAIAGTQTQEDGLLDYLNYLPGRNGQSWLVFPFKINVTGIELNVLLRVLRSENGMVPGRRSAAEDGQLIADISGPKRQWRCFVNKSAGKFRADIRVYPECSQSALDRLRKQAERFLGKKTANFSGFEVITVRNGDKIPLWTEDLWPEYLSFLDEEV